MSKLIILGDTGMLGAYIKRYFLNRGIVTVIGINRSMFDVVLDPIEKLEQLLQNHINANVTVFNAIGIIPQTGIVETDVYNKINAEFPHQLSALCLKYGFKLIHPSTDCVFDGLAGRSYVETDTTTETNAYGVSKARGEPQNCMVIRTSIIGEEINGTKSLVEWVKSNNLGEINGYVNHLWNGITCLQYAKIVERIIVNNIFWVGVKHLCSPRIVSKYELLFMINETYKLLIKVNKFETEISIDKSLATVYDLGFDIPDLDQQIREMREFSPELYQYIIPKNLYLYWDLSPMSYLQYLTVVSFKELNPDWKVILYVPVYKCNLKSWKTDDQKSLYTGKNYLSKFLDLDMVIRKLDFTLIGFNNDIPEVIKSNYLRYWILGNYGGMWSDIDIIYVKPMSVLVDTALQVYGDIQKIDTVICYIDYYYPVGLLLSKQSNPFFLELVGNANSKLDTYHYQCIGSTLFEKLYAKPYLINNKYPELNILVMNHGSYLPYQWDEVEKIYTDSSPENMQNYTVGIHWFNGSPMSVNYQNMIDRDEFPTNGSIYPYIKKYFENKIIVTEKAEYKSYLLSNYNTLYRINDMLNDIGPQHYNSIIVNERQLDSDTISIVMTAANRSVQTYFTIQTIARSEYKNVQVILIDDSDIDCVEVSKLEKYGVHVELINIVDKFWINPCVNYNIGFKHVKGGKIIIQNAEVCHCGDICTYVKETVENGEYHAFNVYGMLNRQQNEKLYSLIDEIFTDTSNIHKMPEKWYQHHEKHNIYFHFLSALTTESFDLVRGFDIDYALGIEYDDNDLLFRIRHIGLSTKNAFVKIPNSMSCGIGVHQWHTVSAAATDSGKIRNYYLDQAKIQYHKKYGKILTLNSLNPSQIISAIIKYI